MKIGEKLKKRRRLKVEKGARENKEGDENDQNILSTCLKISY